MTRKPGRMYRQIRGQAYTRKEYMGGVPAPRITQFDTGSQIADYPVELSLKIMEPCQVRHTALEAARVAANRQLSKDPGVGNYYLKIRTYPHIVLREHKMATGAGADRVSGGMRAAFGKAVGTAARVQADQIIMTVRVPLQGYKSAKDALWRASMKLPSPCYVIVEKGADLLS
ncbi:MAG: 50S ribosomal protein L16 [Methanomassiliicoccales archaeon]|nr:50S ribosomal protein L16 [Methanomassiliicoccales archaeon]